MTKLVALVLLASSACGSTTAGVRNDGAGATAGVADCDRDRSPCAGGEFSGEAVAIGIASLIVLATVLRRQMR